MLRTASNRTQWRRGAGLTACLCLGSLFAPPRTGATSFSIVTLDNQHLEWPSLAIDAAGTSHVAYYAWSDYGGGLEYGRKTATGWTEEAVTGASGFDVSLALDANGGVHLTYFDAGSVVPLRYASRNASGWTQETIEVVGAPGQVTFGLTSLAMDAQAQPHVAYSVSGVLKYAEKTPAGWVIETVDASGSPTIDRQPALALDASGSPRIAYTGDTTVRLASRDASVWSRSTVHTSQGLFSSIAIDASGRVHVSWYDAGSGALQYARQDGPGWSRETLGAGAYPSLALDSSGEPHISFQAGSSLVYASKSATGWTQNTVDGTAISGYESSLAFDAAGHPSIVYEFHTPYRRQVELRYAQGDVTPSGTGDANLGAAWFGPVHPSPTRGTTAGLSFRLPQRQAVTLEVFDVRGRLAAGRPREVFEPGEHVVRWDTGLRASGLYFVRLRTDAGVIGQQRWVLVR